MGICLNDEYFMKEALKEAKLALKEGSWPIGCVIVLNDKIISRAHNKVYLKSDRLAHAEVLALQKAKKSLFDLKSGATIYTTYEPCPMCLGAIVICRLKRVVSGIDVDESGAMHLRSSFPKRFNDKEHSLEHKTGVLAKESYKLFMQSPLVKRMIKRGKIEVNVP